MKIKITLLVAAAALAFAGYLVSEKSQTHPSRLGIPTAADPEEIANRRPVRDFSITDSAGEQKTLADYRGKVILLSFWASWCAPCLVELPTFVELERTYSGRGFEIVPVNVDEGDKGRLFSADFWRQHKFPFANYFDPRRMATETFGVDRLPSNFVIDRQGRLAFSSYGANDWTSPAISELIEGLLLENPQESR